MMQKSTTFRYNDDEMRKKLTSEEAATDKRMAEIQRSLDFYRNHTKAIVFNTPNLVCDKGTRPELIRRLSLHLNTSDLQFQLEVR